MPELRGWAVLQALRDLEEGEEVPMEFRSREMVGKWAGTWDLHLLEVPTSGSASVQSRIGAPHIPLLGQQSQVTIEYVAPWLNARKHVEFIGALFCSFFCQNVFPPAILQADSPDRHQQLLEQWQFECNCQEKSGQAGSMRSHAVPSAKWNRWQRANRIMSRNTLMLHVFVCASLLSHSCDRTLEKTTQKRCIQNRSKFPDFGSRHRRLR